MRYRKKPVVIDAYRYTIDSEVPLLVIVPLVP